MRKKNPADAGFFFNKGTLFSTHEAFPFYETALNNSAGQDEIYIEKNFISALHTVEIRIQGGIIAVNGISSIFMVNAVMVVSETSRTKRDRQPSSHPYPKRQKSERSFSSTLEQAAQEYDAVPLHCLTTVYGRDSKMQNFFYQPREYHY